MKRRRGVMMVGGRSVSIAPLGFSVAGIAGLSGWYKADTGTFQDTAMTTPAVADGDPVGGWQDQSGVGNHLTQATSTKRPTLKLNIQNGLPAIKFDGIDDWIEKLALVGTLAQPNTVFFVTKRAASGTDYRIMDGPGSTRHLLSHKAADTFEIFAGTIAGSGANLIGANCAILTAQFNGASSIGRRNGAQVISANAGAQSCGGFIVGVLQDHASTPFKDYIFEFMFYNALLTAGQIAGVEGYLNGRLAAF